MSAPVTVFTNAEGRLTKRYFKDADGTVKNDKAPALSSGTFDVRQVKDLDELQTLLQSLEQTQAVAYGRPTTDNGRIVTAASMDGTPGAIARTGEQFSWAAGAGILMLDYDAPKDGTPPLTQDDLVATIRAACPFLDGVGMLWRPSASSGIAGVGIKGQRLYIMVDDAAHIHRIGKTIFNRLWLAGAGYMAISSAGTLLDRAPVDASVWRPEGLDYAAAPVLDGGIERATFPAKVLPGAVLFAHDVADLTADESATLSRLKAEARLEKSPEAAQKKASHLTNIRSAANTRGAHLTDADHDSAVENHCLPDAWPLRAQNGNVLTVGEILDDPAQWNEKRFADPLEDDCNDDRVAVAYLRNGSQSCIYSHLHGGVTYTFKRYEVSTDDFDQLPAELPSAATSEEHTNTIPDIIASLREHIIQNYDCADEFDEIPHCVDKWIPQDEVTLLAGHGGGGKSYVALSIAVHVALGLPFGERATTQTNVLFFSGEDGARILRQRLARICRELEIDPAQLDGKLHLLDASDMDPALHREERTQQGTKAKTETHLLHALASLVQELNVGLVVVDNASDTFDDDEIKRVRVRAFIRSLRSRLARPVRAVLLLVHVNKDSATKGRAAGAEDYSGSTAWHNSVRSRLSLNSTDDGALTIEHQKANLGPKAVPMRLEWREGVPVAVDDAIAAIARATSQAENDQADKQALLVLLRNFDGRGEPVTTAVSGCATTFSQLKTAPGFPKRITNKGGLTTLLRALEDEGFITRNQYKTPSRKYKERFTCTGGVSEENAPNTRNPAIVEVPV